jgi:hypothetical protein
VVAVADLLSQIADAPGSVRGSGQHVLGVEPVAQPGYVVRLVAELVEGLVPGGQDFTGGRVEVVPRVLVPDGQLVPAELDRTGRWRGQVGLSVRNDMPPVPLGLRGDDEFGVTGPVPEETVWRILVQQVA